MPVLQVSFGENIFLEFCFYFRCNFHKKCAFAPRNNCAKSDIIPSTFLAGGVDQQYLTHGGNC